MCKGVSGEKESTEVSDGASSSGTWLKMFAIVVATDVRLLSIVAGRPRTGIN